MRALAGLVTIGLSVGACAQILGDEFKVDDASTTVSAGTGGSDGAGVGGNASSSVATGGSAPASGSGGSGGSGGAGVCDDPYDVDVCGPGKKCSVVNVTTGEVACVNTISKPVWSSCTSDQECAQGTFCSPLNKVCKPLCVQNTDCPVGGKCANGWVEIGLPIPGLKLCAAGCNPETGDPCVSPGSTCNYALFSPNQIGFDCVAAGNVPTGGPCSGESQQDLTIECVAGHGCFGNPQTMMGECYPWCGVGPPENCPGGKTCQALNIQDFPEWGICTG